MFEKIQFLVAPAITVLHIGAATAVTWHAVLHKRESRTVASWVGLAWLAPVLGSVAYLCLGINRIERLGASLDINEARCNIPRRNPTLEDIQAANDMVEKHPTFLGLARAGKAITEREISLHNRIDPLVDGDEAYPAMLEAIDKAEHSVTLLSYIFDNDRAGEKFFEALVRAKNRGIPVRVLVDYVGSRYSPRPTIVKRLKEAGVDSAAFLETVGLKMFRYANLRNHRKILVVDGKVGFTGGTNIREGHWLSLDPKEPVQCLHFRIEGPVVAQMQEMFAIDWDFTTGETLTSEPWFREIEEAGNVACRGISDGPDEDIDKMSGILLSALSVASKQVSIVTPYFLPEEAMLAGLVTATVRGVKVDIILPEKNNIPVMDWATEPGLPYLLKKGVRIYKTPEPFDHTKLLVVDSAWALIGSTNWDSRSLRLNFEYNLECYGATFGNDMENYCEKKRNAARPVTLEELSSRNKVVRVRNGVARLFSPYL